MTLNAKPDYECFQQLLAYTSKTMYRVAKDTGIPFYTLTRWKHGISHPVYPTLKAIADYFSVSVDYFYPES